MFFKLFRKNEKAPKMGRQNLTAALELAKQNLISDLETKGVKFLIAKMDSDDDYSDLISERRKTDRSYRSEDSISWYAYRQSDKLNSSQDKEELLELLSNHEYSNLKKYIYCCLSSLCSNTNDKGLFNILIEKVIEEDDDAIKVSILSRLRKIEKDSTYNIDPIKKLVIEGTYDVSHAAIKALSNTKDPEVEDILLDEFKITNRHMKGMICAPLSTVGTLKSIPVLKEAYKKTRDGFLRWSIEEAIQKIEKRENSSQ